jgi:translation initiation factor eIF-2B subunit delta
MTKFAQDRTSGSSDVALAFVDDLERWTAVDTSPSSHALRASLLTFLRAAQAAQPTMGLVHQLAARALDTVDAGVRREDNAAFVRNLLLESCAAERSDLLDTAKATSRLAAELVKERGAWIATLSMSGLVRDAFLAAHAAGLSPQALIAEGRPRLEGRDLATALAAGGVPSWIVADAALSLLIGQASMLWIGADAITDQGVINKVGSYAAALAARERSVPVYALATRRKFLPAATAALKILEMPGEEVWESPPEHVEPRNIYFELVPLDLIQGIVVEDGVLGRKETIGLAQERTLPEELSAG